MSLRSSGSTVNTSQRRFSDRFSQRFSTFMRSSFATEILNQTIFSVLRMDRWWKSLTLMCPNLGELDQVIQLRIPHNNKLITTLMESLRLHRPTHNLLFKIMKKQQLLVFPKLISLCLRVNKSLKISQTLCKLNLPNLNKRSYFILPFYPHNRHS